MDTFVSADIVQFGDFRLDRRLHSLWRRGERGAFAPVPLGSRALELLCVLIDHAGEVVARQTIMDAVWPGSAVEDSNLTVQLSTLRRVLDAGRAGGSCIQTVPGRGYRFVEPVDVPVEPVSAVPEAEVARPAQAAPLRTSRRIWFWAFPGAWAILAVLVVALVRPAGWWSMPPGAPRMSLVVLPFENLGTDPKDTALADGITADLTSDLTRDIQATVTAGAAAKAYKGQAVDPRQVGRALGVRYVVEGNVRQAGTTLRVDVQLTSTETGTQLWSDRFDEAVAEPGATQERIAALLRTGLRDALIQIESARSQRERPNDPDAFDLVLQARAVSLSPISMEREAQELALYERALAIDPSYAPALAGSAYFLIETRGLPWKTFSDMRRAEVRSTEAREIAPQATYPAYAYMYWLKSVGRCPEVIELGRHLISTDPQGARLAPGIYSQLGQCLAQTGHAEEDIALQEQVMQAEPRDQWMFWRYVSIGYDQVLLGRDHDAITSAQRALALNAKMSGDLYYRLLAAAYARTGQIESAHQAFAEADRLWPYMTVRSVSPNYSPNPVYHEQLRRYQEALRLAGLRDHADEDADFGVPSDRALHDVVGRTPRDAPGAVTIRTADLPRLLADAKPLAIDTMWNSWGQSIPGAIGLKYAGLGGDFSDEAQDRLRPKLRELTGGDLGRPIVAVGFNSERFDGRNLALRLVALGYTHIYWYRGGREAWEVAGLPEAETNVEDW